MKIRARVLRVSALGLLLLAGPVRANVESTLELTGRISDFDARRVVVEGTGERFAVDRRAWPESVELQPGRAVQIELPMQSVHALPAKARAPKK